VSGLWLRGVVGGFLCMLVACSEPSQKPETGEQLIAFEIVIHPLGHPESTEQRVHHPIRLSLAPVVGSVTGRLEGAANGWLFASTGGIFRFSWSSLNSLRGQRVLSPRSQPQRRRAFPPPGDGNADRDPAGGSARAFRADTAQGGRLSNKYGSGGPLRQLSKRRSGMTTKDW
jgi:hypothetical protein